MEFQKLIDFVAEKSRNGNLERAFDLANLLGELLWLNEIPVFDLRHIETVLIERCSRAVYLHFDNSVPQADCVFLATDVCNAGGHTRLIESLSTMLPSQGDLLLSATPKPSVHSRITNFFENVEFGLSRRHTLNLDLVKTLATRLLRYKVIVMAIHPNDIASVVACGLVKLKNPDTKIMFVSHADHSFTFGTTVPDSWLYISLYGQKLDDLRNLACPRSFLGIPIKGGHNRAEKLKSQILENHKIKFLSAGNRHKYRPEGDRSIIPLVKRLLETYPGSSFKIIGPKIFREPWWWLTKLKYPNRLTVVESLEYDEYLKATADCDFYIDSYPMTGGTAFAEQFLHGNLCFGLKGKYYGYSPAELLKSDSIKGLLGEIEKPISSEYRTSIAKKIEEIHGFNSVKTRFLGAVNQGSVYGNPMEHYVEVAALNTPVGYPDYIAKISQEGLHKLFISLRVVRLVYGNLTVAARIKWPLRSVVIMPKIMLGRTRVFCKSPGN